MSSKKRKIASALALGATVTGAISSGATSAGLFDWFKSKETLNEKRKEEQKKGYNAAIQLAKNICSIEKGKNKSVLKKSVPQIIHDLISDREEHFLKNLGVSIDKVDNLKIEYTTVAKKLEKYFHKKICKLQKICDDPIIDEEKWKTFKTIEGITENNLIRSQIARYELENKNGKTFVISIPGDDKQRIYILRKLFNYFINKKLTGEIDETNKQNIAEALIDLAKEDTLGQYETEEPTLLNLSYEEIINHLIENKMKDSYTYRDDFYKIFESEGVATILHELGYEENMSLLPSYDKEKGELSIGRAARSFVPTTIVWTLGYFYPPITVVGGIGIVGLLCNAVVQQSASSLWNNLRHKETRTSFLNPNNWEVSKFLSGVVSSFAMYGVCKYIGI